VLISRCGQTANCGHGLRATRGFMPNQIIVEYTGEIITQEESERRMVEVYKDNKVCCLSIIYTYSIYLLTGSELLPYVVSSKHDTRRN